MKKLFTATLALLIFSLAACAPGEDVVNEGGSTGETPKSEPIIAVAMPKGIGYEDYDARSALREANEVDEGFINAINSFTYASASAVLTRNTGYTCISPISLYYALSIAASGASGETQKELLDILGVSDASKLSEQAGRLFRLMYTDNEIGKLIVADSLWLDDTFTVKDEFVRNAVENFYAETYRTDLASENSAAAMTSWVNRLTNGLLNPEFSPDPELVMTILNTIYLSDQWTDEFYEQNNTKGDFTLENGDKVECEFMNRMTGGSFARGEGWLKASLGLKNCGGMTFILPDEGVSVYDLMADPEALSAIMAAENTGYGEVTYSVPKFDQFSDMQLNDALKAMGVQLAFDSDNAEFEALTDEECFISSVIQQCRVKIDEKGVEAAAFTEIAVCGAGMPQDSAELILNRPFIYAITSTQGTVLFIGACMNPLQAQ